MSYKKKLGAKKVRNPHEKVMKIGAYDHKVRFCASRFERKNLNETEFLKLMNYLIDIRMGDVTHIES